jgi:hypothetical protein
MVLNEREIERIRTTPGQTQQLPVFIPQIITTQNRRKIGGGKYILKDSPVQEQKMLKKFTSSSLTTQQCKVEYFNFV